MKRVILTVLIVLVLVWGYQYFSKLPTDEYSEDYKHNNPVSNNEQYYESLLTQSEWVYLGSNVQSEIKINLKNIVTKPPVTGYFIKQHYFEPINASNIRSKDLFVESVMFYIESNCKTGEYKQGEADLTLIDDTTQISERFLMDEWAAPKPGSLFSDVHMFICNYMKQPSFKDKYAYVKPYIDAEPNVE